MRIINGKAYDSYTETLKDLGIMRLTERRDVICLKFAKSSLRLDNFKQLFPKNSSKHDYYALCFLIYECVWLLSSSELCMRRMLLAFITWSHLRMTWRGYWRSSAISSKFPITWRITFSHVASWQLPPILGNLPTIFNESLIWKEETN